MTVDIGKLRQGMGDGLWMDLPAHVRERKHPSPGDAVAPCGRIGFKAEIRNCKALPNDVMCNLCRDAS